MTQQENNSIKEPNESKKYDPIVFVNNPVTESNYDVIGFDSQVKTIEQAIADGATMIGLVADYGTGKSSMTELLCDAFVKQGNPKPIKINMWDSLIQENPKTDSTSISNLTKSFLFQLANGKNSTFSRYVNKMLSKNYGNISFATNKPTSFVLWAIIAGILFAFYKMSGISGTGVLSYVPEWVKYVVPFIKALSPWFLVCSVAALIWGMRNLSIAYSHWKMGNNRTIEINDVFDTYRTIIDEITPQDGKKQLVFIDDLDRINDKETIVSFLKELYRFRESITEDPDKIVFIISVKPESELVSGKQVDLIDENKNDKKEDTNTNNECLTKPLVEHSLIYHKVFDATLFLKPIHFDDYDSILLRLIKSNTEKKLALEELIGKKIDETLPVSFRWIKYGTNLTLRDLKDRLNHAIAIMVSLKNKSHENNSAADFNACAAVAYLESQFPNDYYRLIKDEESFAKFIKRSYTIVDKTEVEENIDELKDFYKECFSTEEYSEQFIKVLCGMVMEKTFKDDFRMYFYTYPKDSHIKTTEERELCNCLLYPKQYPIPSNLDDCVSHAYKTGKNDTVEKTIKPLETFPLIVIENAILLDQAVKVSMTKAIAVFKKHVIDNDTAKKDLSVYWGRIKGIKGNNKNRFIDLCIQKVAELSEPEEIIQRRLSIIKGLGDEVLAFKSLFDGVEDMPQITPNEIDAIADPSVFVPLISVKNIKLEQQEYLCSALNSTQLSFHEGVWDKAVAVIKAFIAIAKEDAIAADVLEFLKINRYLDLEMFSVVCSANISHQQIADYINIFDVNELPKEYLELLNELGFSGHIKEQIVYSMMEHTLFFTPILFYTKNNSLHMMNEFLGYREKIREACHMINDIHPDTVIEFRKHCLSVNAERLDDLFFEKYPLITADEYRMFEETIDAIKHINTEIIDKENVSELLRVIYSREYSIDELISLFEYMFKSDVNPQSINDTDLIDDIIHVIDFRKLGVKRLTYEQRSYLYATFSNKYSIDSAVEAIAFLKHFGCLIPEVEQIINEDKDASDDYCTLIAEMDELSDATFTWIESNYLIAPLSQKLCEILLDKGWPIEYIIGNILREKRMIMDPRVEFNHYFAAYTEFKVVFDIMSDHWDFLEQLQQKGDLEKLTEDQLIPIFKVRQTQRFFTFMLSEKTSLDMKKQYLEQFKEFKTESDSVAFQKLICKPENIKLVDSVDLKNSIYQRLWDTNRYHKGSFTKYWNKEWADKLLPKKLA